MTHHQPPAPRRLRRTTAGLGAAAIAVTATVVGLPSGSSSAAPDAGASTSAATRSGERPGAAALLRPVAAGTGGASDLAAATPPATVEGEHQLVTLRASALPDEVAATDDVVVSLPPVAAGGSGPSGSDDAEPTLVDITEVERTAGQTVWQGAALGEPTSSFTLVEADATMRGSLVTDNGIFALTPADGDRYWWTRVDVLDSAGQPDDVVLADPADDTAGTGGSAGAAGAAPAGAAAAALAPKKKGKKGRKGGGKAKIGIMFAYTKDARDAVGGKPNLKAAAVLAVAQTNQALANSGVKAKLKFRGLAKTKGKVAVDSATTNVKRLYKPRDGSFDNLQRVRQRKGADLVHLLASGTKETSCGAGYAPTRAREARPVLGWASTYVQCLAQLTATHEIGHNLGADHDDFPGVNHSVKTKGAYGYNNPAAGYMSVMSYFDACVAARVNCTRVLFYSSPKNTYLGQPLGSSKKTNNSKVIKMVAPRVARYVR